MPGSKACGVVLDCTVADPLDVLTSCQLSNTAGQDECSARVLQALIHVRAIVALAATFYHRLTSKIYSTNKITDTKAGKFALSARRHRAPEVV